MRQPRSGSATGGRCRNSLVRCLLRRGCRRGRGAAGLLVPKPPPRSLFSAATMSCKYWTSLYIVWCAFFFDAVVLTVAIPVLPTFLAKLNVSQTAIGALFASKVR